MKTQITKLSACLALFVVSGCILYPSVVFADATGYASAPSTLLYCAELTSVIGQVQKAAPIDMSKTALGQFVSCKKGDQLTEGTVIQTGKNSMAEMKWSNGKFVTRLSENSLARLTPNARRVFLSTGDLIFKKDQNNTEIYTIETKRLQARIRGTTVRSRSTVFEDQFEVVESHYPVVVKNLINGSVVNLSPGLVLVVRAKKETNSIPSSMLPKGQTIAQSSQNDLRLDPSKGELIFEDKYSTTMVYTANSKAVLEDPLVTGCPDLAPIDSIDLIRTTMESVPSSENKLSNFVQSAINFGHPDKWVTKNLTITRVPDRKYSVGPNIAIVNEFKPGAIVLPHTDTFPTRLDPPWQKYQGKNQIAAIKPVMMIPSFPVTPVPYAPVATSDKPADVDNDTSNKMTR